MPKRRAAATAAAAQTEAPADARCRGGYAGRCRDICCGINTDAELLAMIRNRGYALWQLLYDAREPWRYEKAPSTLAVYRSSRTSKFMLHYRADTGALIHTKRLVCPSPANAALLQAAAEGRFDARECFFLLVSAEDCGAAHAGSTAAAATPFMHGHYRMHIVPRGAATPTPAALMHSYTVLEPKSDILLALVSESRGAPTDAAEFMHACAMLRYDGELAVTVACIALKFTRLELAVALERRWRDELPAAVYAALDVSEVNTIYRECFDETLPGLALTASTTKPSAAKTIASAVFFANASRFSPFAPTDLSGGDGGADDIAAALSDSNLVLHVLSRQRALHFEKRTMFTLTAGTTLFVNHVAGAMQYNERPYVINASIDAVPTRDLLTIIPHFEKNAEGPVVWAPYLAPGSVACDVKTCTARALVSLAVAEPRKPLLCTRCQRAVYCSAECQARAWPTHKLTCVAPEPVSV